MPDTPTDRTTEWVWATELVRVPVGMRVSAAAMSAAAMSAATRTIVCGDVICSSEG